MTQALATRLLREGNERCGPARTTIACSVLHHCAGQLCTDIRQQGMCEPSPSCCAGFFGQFGSVKNVRLSRSKRTAKSKGFAFVEFKCPEVAPIAAKAMDGYMMFSQKLKVHAVRQKDVHPELFKGGSSSPFCRAAAACLARCLDSQPRLRAASWSAKDSEGDLLDACSKLHVTRVMSSPESSS